MIVRIKYFKNKNGETVQPLEKISKGDWIDLRVADDTEIKAGNYYMIPLGIGMELPLGYEANVVPRSSTFKNWGLLQTNCYGVIDNSYCGDNDQWHFPCYATRDTVLHKDDRVCQFRLNEIQPTFAFTVVEHLKGEDRGGFGSTGKK